MHATFVSFKDVRKTVGQSRGAAQLCFRYAELDCNHMKTTEFIFVFGLTFPPIPCFAGVAQKESATRAKPNAFHFRRQVIIVQRAGGGSAQRQFAAPCC